MQLTILQIVLIGLWTGICWTGMLLGTYMFRSIVLATGVGIILGDVQTGLAVGAIAELAFMGFGVGAGGTVPPSPLGPGIVGAIIAITTKTSPAVAFTLSIPFAIAFQFLQTSLYVLMSGIAEAAKRAVEKGEYLKFRLYSNSTFILFLIGGFILGAFCAGASSTVKVIVEALPPLIVQSLKLAGQMLPAIGFATILSVMSKKELLPYMLIGYVAMAYLELPIMAIAFIGLIAALFYFFKADNTNSDNTVKEEVEFEDGI